MRYSSCQVFRPNPEVAIYVYPVYEGNQPLASDPNEMNMRYNSGQVVYEGNQPHASDPNEMNMRYNSGQVVYEGINLTPVT